MALTDRDVRAAKPKEKRYMLSDDDGLYCEVMVSGSKVWKYRYWVDKKETKVTLGHYPDVSLREAREKRDDLRKGRAHGVDPKKAMKPDIVPESPTFKKIGREWFETQINNVKSKSYSDTVIYRLEKFLFPKIGYQPIANITAPDVLVLLRAIEGTGNVETAHRVLQICGRVLRYGVSTGVCTQDVTSALKGALTPTKRKHHAALTDERDIAGLIRAIESFRGSFLVKSALLFSAHTFLRPGEVRHLEWAEVNFDKQEIRIPAEKMKARRLHVVPLSQKVMDILQALKPLTGTGRYVFPSNRSYRQGDIPMSENTVAAALRRLGYSKDEMSAHGFRGMATTMLYEHNFLSDMVERQLAHVVGNDVRQAYDYSQLLDERRKMMEHWSDWLNSLV